MKYLSILIVGVALLAGGCGEKEVADDMPTKKQAVADEKPAKEGAPTKAPI